MKKTPELIHMKIRNFNFLKYLLWIYLAVLIFGTVLKTTDPEQMKLSDKYILNIRWDYIMHAIVYLPLPLLLNWNYTGKTGKKDNGKTRLAGKTWLNFFLALFIATGLEVFQMLIPYRTFNVNDLLANGLGAILGFPLFLWVSRALKGEKSANY